MLRQAISSGWFAASSCRLAGQRALSAAAAQGQQAASSSASANQPKPYAIREGGADLFVGNLPWKVSHQQVLEHFSPYGSTNVRFLLDKQTKRFKGIGFVTVDNDKVDQHTSMRPDTLVHALTPPAIADLADKEFQGRTLKVGKAYGRRMDAAQPAAAAAPAAAEAAQQGAKAE